MTVDEQAVLRNFKALVSNRVTLHKVILFGSRARGDAAADSDLDVLVVTEGPADEASRDWISDCAWDAGFEAGLVIVPIVYGRSEWETGPERHSLLARAIEREGVPV